MSAVKTKQLPALRFPEFTEPWQEKRGRELFGSRRTRGNKNLPIYSVTLTKGVVPRDSLARQMGADAAADSHLKAEPGDLIYNMMRMWQGAVGRTDVECMISPAYVVLAPNGNINSKWFFYNLQRARSLYNLWAYSYGLTSDRLRLYYRDFGFIKFHIPLLPEQEKISTVIATVDKKLEVLRRKRELLQVYKRVMMQKIFLQELRFKADDGAEFPVWEKKRLGEIASRINSGGTPSSDISRYWGGNCPWISGADFDNNNIKGIRRSVTDEGIKESSTFVASKGDLLFVTRTGVGKIAIAPVDVAVSQDITAMSFSVGIDERFVYFYFQSFKKSLLKSNQGTSINGIVRKDLVKVTIAVPNLEEQRKIADFLSAIDAKIDAAASQIDKMKSFKNGLLQQMFV